MKLDKAYGTDANLEEEGKWFDLGDGGRILVGRFGSRTHERVMERLRKPYEHLLARKGKIPKDEMSDMIRESIASGVLLGWEGLEEEGESLTFSKEEALRLFTEYKDFYDQVFDLSNDAANFRAYVQEEIVKK